MILTVFLKYIDLFVLLTLFPKVYFVEAGVICLCVCVLDMCKSLFV